MRARRSAPEGPQSTGEYVRAVKMLTSKPIRWLGFHPLLLRAQLHCVFGGARLGLKTTRRIGRSQLRILDHLTAPEIRSADSEQVLRTVIDDVRGCLRKIAEDASVEVARLSAEMGKLDARARGLGIDGSNSPQAYHRRWKVKP